MGLLIFRPIGKLNRVSIRALLVIFKKEVIEKKLFNTLTKLAWGHEDGWGFSPSPSLCPAPNTSPVTLPSAEAAWVQPAGYGDPWPVRHQCAPLVPHPGKGTA